MVDKTEYIKRFREIYKQKSGEAVPEEVALVCFENLVVLVEAVYKPIYKK